jgi:hypothetical protein
MACAQGIEVPPHSAIRMDAELSLSVIVFALVPSSYSSTPDPSDHGIRKALNIFTMLCSISSVNMSLIWYLNRLCAPRYGISLPPIRLVNCTCVTFWDVLSQYTIGLANTNVSVTFIDTCRPMIHCDHRILPKLYAKSSTFTLKSWIAICLPSPSNALTAAAC